MRGQRQGKEREGQCGKNPKRENRTYEHSKQGVGLMVKHFLVSTVVLLMVRRLSINLSITRLL